MANRLSKSWGLRSIEVYPNPLPFSRYTPTEGKDWLYVGRIERRKGVHLLINAYSAICAQRSPPPLRLVGRPYGSLPCGRPYGEFIRELIRESGMRERITWIEGVPQGSVQEFYGRSSVAFFPSLWENFSYSCLEAMASGCVVVAGRCGGFPEMIEHGKSGFLFEPGNVSSLIQVMNTIIESDACVGAIGHEAREFVKNRCDQPVVCAQAENFYKLLIERQRHG
jgi:glycogen synthase